MKVSCTTLPGVLLLEPDVFTDARGSFYESYHLCRYAEAGIGASFVQDNHSESLPGTLRGLHYQLMRPQGKLIRVTRGAVFDVAVDVRRGSPTFGAWVSATLSADNHHQLYIPPGFAHGFYVASGPAVLEYKCTDFYEPDDQHGIRWDDPDLAIPWPDRDPILSERDRGYLGLRALRDDLPPYRDD